MQPKLNYLPDRHTVKVGKFGEMKWPMELDKYYSFVWLDEDQSFIVKNRYIFMHLVVESPGPVAKKSLVSATVFDIHKSCFLPHGYLFNIGKVWGEWGDPLAEWYIYLVCELDKEK